jgi:hypothetical protein
MPNQQLIEYIKRAQAGGMTKGQIRDALLGAGWREEDIDAIYFSEVGGRLFHREPLRRWIIKILKSSKRITWLDVGLNIWVWCGILTASYWAINLFLLMPYPNNSSSILMYLLAIVGRFVPFGPITFFIALTTTKGLIAIPFFLIGMSLTETVTRFLRARPVAKISFNLFSLFIITAVLTNLLSYI